MLKHQALLYVNSSRTLTVTAPADEMKTLKDKNIIERWMVTAVGNRTGLNPIPPMF